MRRFRLAGAAMTTMIGMLVAFAPYPASAETKDLPPVCTGLGPSPKTSAVSVSTVIGPDTALPPDSTLTRLDYGDGADIVLPPPGWTPLSATDRELEVFAVPPRPVDPDELKAWNQTWSNYKETGSPDFCPTSYQASTLSSPNWSGKLDHCAPGYCKKVSGVFVEPAYDDATCGSSATHGIWTGLGGYDDGGLLQSGTFHTGTSTHYMFWEYLNRYNPNPPATVPVQVIVGGIVHAGDNIQATTWYYTDSASGTPRVSMSVLNVSTGMYYAKGPFSSINGYPLSDYWNGRTAEYINERLQTSTGYTYYARPVGNYVRWTSAYTNSIAANSATFIPDDVKMHSDDGNRFLGYPGAFGTGASFTNYWQYCL